MQNVELAHDYVKRAKVRLEAVALLLQLQSYADVVREAQECVELALKALLRRYGIQPPRIHDVSAIILEERSRFPQALQGDLERLCAISKSMRRDRELAFYGTEDLTPSSFYNEQDARSALADARLVVEAVHPHIMGSP